MVKRLSSLALLNNIKLSKIRKCYLDMTDTYTNEVISRLEQLGFQLPDAPPPPAGFYEPFRLERGFGFLAAQVPGYADPALLGRVGLELTAEQGYRAAELAALNALARIRQALGDFERLRGLLHVAGHVASAESFLEQPGVLDGASRLFVNALGERGRHSRTAFPTLRLPRNISIELEITFAYNE